MLPWSCALQNPAREFKTCLGLRYFSYRFVLKLVQGYKNGPRFAYFVIHTLAHAQILPKDLCSREGVPLSQRIAKGYFVFWDMPAQVGLQSLNVLRRSALIMATSPGRFIEVFNGDPPPRRTSLERARQVPPDPLLNDSKRWEKARQRALRKWLVFGVLL